MGSSMSKCIHGHKKYLTNPPILGAPIKGRPLILYTAAIPTSLGALLAQTDDVGKEISLYYLSRTLQGAECNYTDIEKICLALVFAAQKASPLHARTYIASCLES